jgi:hypothetical protein
MIFAVVASALWFSVFVAVHLLVMALRPVAGRFRLIARTFLLCCVGSVATILVVMLAVQARGPLFQGGIVGSCVVAALTMACLFVLYMPFFYTVAASLSVQSIILLSELPQTQRTAATLRDRFVSEEILAKRMEGMVFSGYLIREGNRYRLTAKGRKIAAMFQWLKDLWKLGAGG